MKMGIGMVLAAVLAIGTAHGGSNVPLISLTPSATEFGMVKDVAGISTVEGPGQVDAGPYSPTFGPFWTGNAKIVKAIDPARKLGEGQSYKSAMEDIFAVQGDFVTGVGLWVKTRNMYHWVEYAIPAGATRFTARLMATDDARGYIPHESPMNQEFFFRVLIDGTEVAGGLDKQRLQVAPGAGEKLADLDVPIPAGAKVIRFRLTASAWGDGNNNVELVLNDGNFVK